MSVAQAFAELLKKYPPDPWAKSAYFTAEELSRLEEARQSICRDALTVIYAVYENPFGNAGGILKVAEHLPFDLTEAGQSVVVISPFHANLSGARKAALRDVGVVDVPFGHGDGRRGHAVALREFYLKHNDAGGVEFVDQSQSEGAIRWILLDSESFFNAHGGQGNNNPYDYASPEDVEVDSDRRLSVDSLFFSTAIPRAMAHLGLTKDVLVHAQDWQVAAVGLTVKQAILDGTLQSAAAVLTMHNPYDCWLPRTFLRYLTDRWQGSYWRPFEESKQRPQRRTTFYQCMLPLFDAPVSTVSDGFAAELTLHPLQTFHFAQHLQSVFRMHGVVGVNNGLFEKPTRTYAIESVKAALAGQSQAILEEKQQKRRRMLQLVANYQQQGTYGKLTGENDDLTSLPDVVPVFMMFGRMDPGQKGFDVLANAIRRINPGKARFILMPNGITEGSRFVQDLRQLAEERDGDVVVFPFRMSLEDYFATMGGVSFCVMPSLYEPFGAATEPYLHGTPVVARATGGLLQQVVDIHEDPATGTGILARDDFSADKEELGRLWQSIQEAGSPAERLENELYQAIVDGLADALERAIAVSRFESDVYAAMLAHLYQKAVEFSWGKAAGEYDQIYDVACR